MPAYLYMKAFILKKIYYPIYRAKPALKETSK